MHAFAVSGGIFYALRNAASQPEREAHWREQADKLERKFTTEHGSHYSYFLERK
jgi:hypothetical protein